MIVVKSCRSLGESPCVENDNPNLRVFHLVFGKVIGAMAFVLYFITSNYMFFDLG